MGVGNRMKYLWKGGRKRMTKSQEGLRPEDQIKEETAEPVLSPMTTTSGPESDGMRRSSERD